MTMTIQGWNLALLFSILPITSSFHSSPSDYVWTLSGTISNGKILATQRSTEEFLAYELIPDSAQGEGRIRAPAVDSTLLRFLSEQNSRFQEPAEFLNKQGVERESWLAQFMCKRVADMLIDCGAPTTVAQEAAMVVQTHALSRTKQRRVRDFLKKREMEWSLGSDRKGLFEYSFPEYPEYGIKDIISLLQEYGLNGYDIAVILSHTPGIALMMPRKPSFIGENSLSGKTLEETIETSFEGLLQTTLGLKRYDARKVLRLCPGLLTKRGSKRAEDIVSLMRGMGVSLKSLVRDRKGLPVLLSRSPSSVFRLITFLASDALRIPVNQIGPILRNHKCKSVLDTVAPVSFIEPRHFSETSSYQHVKQGVSSSDIGNRRQSINNAYKNMSKTAWTLRYHIGTKDLAKVIATYPSVLMLDVEKQILPTAAYLMNDLGICQDDLPRVLQLYPFLLGRDIKEMEKTVDYLINLGVEEEKLCSIFRAFPALLSMDKASMKPVVDFLKEIGIANVGRFVSRLPSVLGYDVRDLRPKWSFLSQVCLYPSFELSTFPAYFSYPIDRVTRPRYEYLKYVKKIPTELLALDLVVRYGDRDFAKYVAKDRDGGKKFVTFLRLRAERRKKATKSIRRKRIGS